MTVGTGLSDFQADRHSEVRPEAYDAALCCNRDSSLGHHC